MVRLRPLLGSRAAAPDVVWVVNRFDPEELSDLDDELEDLGSAPYRASSLLQQFLPFDSPGAASGKAIVTAIPATVDPGTLLYRKALLDQAGVTEADLTRSWEAYLEAGRRVKAATGAYLFADVNEILDVVIRSGVEAGASVFVDAKGRPAVDSPRFRRAFELAKAARASGLDARVEPFSGLWLKAMRDGTVATEPVAVSDVGRLRRWIPETSGAWRVAQLPGGAFVSWGGSFYAIPKRAAHKHAAWEFIRFMCFEADA